MEKYKVLFPDITLNDMDWVEIIMEDWKTCRLCSIIFIEKCMPETHKNAKYLIHVVFLLNLRIREFFPQNKIFFRDFSNNFLINQ